MKSFYYLKQFFPLTYRAEYTTEDNIKHFAVWKMWFGKVYKVDRYIVKKKKVAGDE